MSLINFVSFIIIASVLISCKKEPQEGARNTFTLKGKLVEDCSEKPAVNMMVYLEAEYDLITDSDYEVIAEAQTDGEGNFSLSYKSIKKPNVTALRFYAQTPNNRFLMLAPINQSSHRDISLAHCHQHLILLEGKANADSLYLIIGKPIDETPYIMSSVPGSDPNYKYPIIKMGIDEVLDINVIKVEAFTSATWNNKVVNHTYMAATTYDDIVRAVQHRLVDTVDFPGYEYDYTIRGYPMIDTIRIEL